jgi:hypothetical protein
MLSKLCIWHVFSGKDLSDLYLWPTRPRNWNCHSMTWIPCPHSCSFASGCVCIYENIMISFKCKNFKINTLWTCNLKHFSKKALWPWPLTQSPRNQLGSSTSHTQPQYQIWRLDQSTLKQLSGQAFRSQDPSDLDIWSIDLKSNRGHLMVMTNSMPNMKTVGQRILKLYEGQAFFSKDPSDLWPQNQLGSSTSQNQLKTVNQNILKQSSRKAFWT